MMETVLAAIQDVEKRMATKEEIKGLATKEEMKGLATREEMRGLERRVMDHVDLRFEQLRDDFGVQRELVDDHATRITALELHTGLKAG
jgi:hypothetical protein